MADFLGPYGIRVNSVAPAIVASGLMGPDRIVRLLRRLIHGKTDLSPTSRESLTHRPFTPDDSPSQVRTVEGFGENVSS